MQRFIPIGVLFKGRHFDGEIIILCVSWYRSFKLSLRDLVVIMADRGITLTHTSILRWVQRHLAEFETLEQVRAAGRRILEDETYKEDVNHAAKSGMPGFHWRRLAIGKIELANGKSAMARNELRMVQQEAEAKGSLLIAQKAKTMTVPFI